MAYTINLTNGTVLTTIADGTVNDSSTALTLIGKNYSGYGTYLNDNLVHLLENFSDDTPPTTPLTGQLWWDTAGNLNVYNGSRFVNLAAVTSSTSAPSGPKTGNQWWDTTNNQFNVYNGAGWTLVGPAFASNGGTIISETITDSNATSHSVLSVNVGTTRISIVSKDSAFTPAVAIAGFPTIKPGFNMVTSAGLAGATYWGTASDASALGNVAAANYARTDTAETFDSTVTINNNSGLTVGTGNNFTAQISGNIVQLVNNINGADMAFRVNIGGTVANAIAISGASGAVTIPNALVVSGSVTGATGTYSGNVAVGGIASTGSMTATTLGLTGNLTTTANVTVSGNINATYLVGTAVQSWYADLAERFEADNAYEPGTVLAIGGPAEVTQEDQELSENVFGVVSTNAGYLMNAGMGPDATHPQVAVNGRVPVKVTGQVRKGDRLVSAGNGLARAGTKAEITPFNVIGRSLQNKTSDGVGSVLAIVKLNS